MRSANIDNLYTFHNLMILTCPAGKLVAVGVRIGDGRRSTQLAIVRGAVTKGKRK